MEQPAKPRTRRWRRTLIGLSISAYVLIAPEIIARLLWQLPAKELPVWPVNAVENVLQRKPTDFEHADIRIICFGESTMAGWPHPVRLSPSKMMEAQLRARFPSRSVQVWDAATNAEGVRHIARLVRATLHHAPTAVFVYVGHNELVRHNADVHYALASREPAAIPLAIMSHSSFLTWIFGYLNPHFPFNGLVDQQTYAERTDLIRQAWRDVLHALANDVATRSPETTLFVSSLVSNDTIPPHTMQAKDTPPELIASLFAPSPLQPCPPRPTDDRPHPAAEAWRRGINALVRGEPSAAAHFATAKSNDPRTNRADELLRDDFRSLDLPNVTPLDAESHLRASQPLGVIGHEVCIDWMHLSLSAQWEFSTFMAEAFITQYGEAEADSSMTLDAFLCAEQWMPWNELSTYLFLLLPFRAYDGPSEHLGDSAHFHYGRGMFGEKLIETRALLRENPCGFDTPDAIRELIYGDELERICARDDLERPREIYQTLQTTRTDQAPEAHH